MLGNAARGSCFCGFKYDNGVCEIPPVIQEYIRSTVLLPTADMAYLKTNIISIQRGNFFLHQNERVQRTLRILWPNAAGMWPCPELDPSDHWGIIKNSSAWVQSDEGNIIHANDLLEVSGGPFRVGTLGTVLSESRRKITPMDREGAMNPSDGSPITGIFLPLSCGIPYSIPCGIPYGIPYCIPYGIPHCIPQGIPSVRCTGST